MLLAIEGVVGHDVAEVRQYVVLQPLDEEGRRGAAGWQDDAVQPDVLELLFLPEREVQLGVVG
jgi:hypothetical protein